MTDATATYSVVWFKRDLRVHDHVALLAGAQRGRVLCLYVIEPSVWAEPDAAAQHFAFLLESLRVLHTALRRVGGRLEVVTGEVATVLARLHQCAPFSHLESHQETGNARTFARDKEVAELCKRLHVRWTEHAQFGVVRRLRSRDEWHAAWETHMRSPVLSAPSSLSCVALPWERVKAPTPQALGLTQRDPPHRQRGGRALALETLQNFLQVRSAQYSGGISSPLSAVSACSRLSPYLALGCISMREAVRSTRAAREALPAGAAWQRRGLTSFLSRLHWHCHFIQKLESEPAIETENMHRGYDGLRELEWSDARFEALRQGQTGWPLVDACVAMLRETGWLNFRMRAMLVSVASYPLWLHWRPVGLWLAQQFLDYEPGIHWSQMQMQAGTTGINTTRVYNPIKQARDHDPKGEFVRRWLPYMQNVPDAWLFEPWRMPEEVQLRTGLRVGVEIPLPVVDLAEATRVAKARLHARRGEPKVRAANVAVVKRHGSRRSGHKRPKSKPTDGKQLALGF